MEKICIVLSYESNPGLSHMEEEIIEELSTDFEITTDYQREGQYLRCTVVPESISRFLATLNNAFPIDDQLFETGQFDLVKEKIHNHLNNIPKTS